MNQNANNIKILKNYSEEHADFSGFWKEELWKLEKCPYYEKTNRTARKTIDFNVTNNENIKDEVKFFLFRKMKEKDLSLNSVFGHYGTVSLFFLSFIDKCYPKLQSITVVPRNEMLLKYQTYALEKGKKLKKEGRYDKNRRKGEYKTYEKSTEYLIVFKQIYDFYEILYDEREETEKDIWDVRNLNVNYVNASNSDYKLDFTVIEENYRPLAKKYIKLRLISQQSLAWSTATNWIRSGILHFFEYISTNHPTWKDLKQLQRKDIENYLNFIRNRKIGKNLDKSPSEDAIKREMLAVESFLNFIQRLDWEEAPEKSVSQLIFEHDKPKKQKIKAADIKYVPDDVWEQLINNIDKLDKKYIPMVSLLEATGFRISDVCTLKLDCLEEKKDGYWIVGDQMKVKEKDHRVPVSKEIASVVLAQQELIKKVSTKENNPNNYLFPTLEGKRKGQPISKQSLVENLHKLANTCNIKDKNGEIYYFKGHAFRHRYAVNLINNGMNLLHVQKLMAHASPEMTLVYAQIHDNTLRKEWEKARDKGAVRIDLSGQVIAADIDQQAEENGLELEWIRHNLDSVRLDHGFCIKSPKVSCDFLEQVVEPPCIKNNCRSFHVDQTFADYYTEQIEKMKSDIEIYTKSGRTRSIELTEKKMERYIQIRDGLLNEGTKMGLPKAKREYVGEEKSGGKING